MAYNTVCRLMSYLSLIFEGYLFVIFLSANSVLDCCYRQQVGEISYHDFQGILVNEAEKESIVNDFKENSKVRAVL